MRKKRDKISKQCMHTASGRCWHWDAALNIKSMVAARGSSFESIKSS